MSSMVKCGTLRHPVGANPANIKVFSSSMVAITLPPLLHLSSRSLILLHSSILLLHSFICPCYPTLSLSTHSQYFSHPTMVTSTRTKNKLVHPAAPVMTDVIAVVVCDYFIARRCYFFLFLFFIFLYPLIFFHMTKEKTSIRGAHQEH